MIRTGAVNEVVGAAADACDTGPKAEPSNIVENMEIATATVSILSRVALLPGPADLVIDFAVRPSSGVPPTRVFLSVPPKLAVTVIKTQRKRFESQVRVTAGLRYASRAHVQ